MVLWNPWIEKTKGLSDMADEEYVNMVCLEPGLVSLRYPFPLRAITLIQ
jgi:glucose-6-phosphate 1-epimerase